VSTTFSPPFPKRFSLFLPSPRGVKNLSHFSYGFLFFFAFPLSFRDAETVKSGEGVRDFFSNLFLFFLALSSFFSFFFLLITILKKGCGRKESEVGGKGR